MKSTIVSTLITAAFTVSSSMSSAAGVVTSPKVSPRIGFLQCQDSSPRASAEDLKKRNLLTTFTTDFWRTLEMKIGNFPEPLRKTGFVIGDFHFNNLGLYYDFKNNETYLMLNDLDDAGTNYLVGDILKFLSYLQSLKKKVDLKEVLKSYEDGLKGSPSDKPPRDLRDLMEMDKFDAQKAREKYLENREEEGKAYRSEKMTDAQSEMFRQLESGYLTKTGLRIDRRWITINETGSSAGMERYLFMTTNTASSTMGAIEFKGLKCSAAGSPNQQNIKLNFEAIRGYILSLINATAAKNKRLDPQSNLASQSIAQVGNRFFLSRVKMPNFMAKLKIQDMKPDDVQKYAEYFAQYLGYFHSRNADAAYQTAVRENRNLILDQMKEVGSTFVKSVRDEKNP